MQQKENVRARGHMHVHSREACIDAGLWSHECQGWRAGGSDTGTICGIADKAGRRPREASHKQLSIIDIDDVVDGLHGDLFPDQSLAAEW